MRTKQLLSVLMFLIATTSIAQAQKQDSTDKMRTIFSGKMKHPRYIGIYATPEIGYTQINGTSAMLAGFQAGWLFNKKWGVAVAAYGTPGRQIESSTSKGQYLRAGYGGVRIEYTPNPNAPVHLSFPLLIGGGMTNLDSLNNRDRGFGRNGGRGNDMFGPKNNNTYVVIQPGIQVEANLFRYAKLYVGASYRFGIEQKQNNPLIASNALNGVTLSAGMKVGLFDLDLDKIHNRHQARRERRRNQN